MTDSASMTKDISFIFTLYNRGDEILRTVKTLMDVIQRNLSSLDYEIILCNDGSTDSTFSVCQRLAEQYPQVRLVSYEENQGRGYAVRKSLETCLGEKIMYMDSDVALTSDLSILPEVLSLMDSRPVVIGDRYHSFHTLHRSLSRMIVGYGYRWMKKFFFPELHISDCEVGFKAFKGEVLKQAVSFCKENRWSFDLELLWILYLQGIPVYQIPIPWNERHGHYKSSVNLFNDSLTQLLGFFRIRFRHKSIPLCKV